MTWFVIGLPAVARGTSGRMDIQLLGHIIVDTGYQLHRKLGPGLLESVYPPVLARDLDRRGLEEAFRADIIVERQVVNEVKSVAVLAPVHYSQLLTYLLLLGLPVGYLINFGSPLYEAGIKKVVNGFASEVG